MDQKFGALVLGALARWMAALGPLKALGFPQGLVAHRLRFSLGFGVCGVSFVSFAGCHANAARSRLESLQLLSVSCL